MKTSTASRTLTVARTGLTIAAIAVASCAADDRTNELAGLTNSAPTMSTASSSEVQPCTGHQSHTLFLEDTDGAAFRLVHVRGCGWKQVAGGNSGDSLALRKMSLSPAAASQAATTVMTGDPLAVFIDGPTGYTFVWTGDTGWKFVGSLSDETH